MPLVGGFGCLYGRGDLAEATVEWNEPVCLQHEQHSGCTLRSSRRLGAGKCCSPDRPLAQ